jgi:hypothetical protein
MESAHAFTGSTIEQTWLGKLARVGIQPRQTMRRILDQPRDRMVIPLLLLAFLSAVFRDLSLSGLRQAATTTSPLLLAVIITGVLMVVALVTLLLFVGLSWIVAGIGRFLGGQGRAREVRSAVAWGLAPFIWALLYRLPAAFFQPASAEGRALELAELFEFGGAAFAFALVEVLIIVWYLIVASATLGEAHRFSSWRGFATLMIALISPLILIVAAVLTSVT